jgi:methyl-accepting chemotaxis protein
MNLNRLDIKFTLILIGVFLIGVVIGGIVLWQALQRSAQAEVTSRGLILIETMNAVRSYTSNNVGPRLVDDLAIEEDFIPETVPGFSAREVFEGFRRNETYATFLYKEATLNPTNPRDQADSFETDLVQRMRREAALDEISGFRQIEGEEVFYIARPLEIKEESCLACHSTPEAAPANLVATYGPENGFSWQLNQIVAAQMIYVPAQEVFDTALRSFWLVMTLYVLVFGVIIFLINLLLRRYVIEPVSVVGEVAQKISNDEVESADIESAALSRVTTRTDELGSLAKVFQAMAREVYARTQKLKEQVQELRIEIDQMRRTEEVKEVVSTEFFKDLQSRAKRMRQQRRNRKSDIEDESGT